MGKRYPVRVFFQPTWESYYNFSHVLDRVIEK
jgi:hypothetical protein